MPEAVGLDDSFRIEIFSCIKITRPKEYFVYFEGEGRSYGEKYQHRTDTAQRFFRR